VGRGWGCPKSPSSLPVTVLVLFCVEQESTKNRSRKVRVLGRAHPMVSPIQVCTRCTVLDHHFLFQYHGMGWIMVILVDFVILLLWSM
jgi:hypothetical protein